MPPVGLLVVPLVALQVCGAAVGEERLDPFVCGIEGAVGVNGVDFGVFVVGARVGAEEFQRRGDAVQAAQGMTSVPPTRS